MEKALKEFLASLALQRRSCPWAKKQGLAAQLRELESEVKELRAALKKKDTENIREEYGDVVWDTLMFGVIAEEKGLFKIKGAVEGAHAKLVRRKPWVFGGEKVSTSAEAVRRWNEIKALEKLEKRGRKRWNEIKKLEKESRLR